MALACLDDGVRGEVTDREEGDEARAPFATDASIASVRHRPLVPGSAPGADSVRGRAGWVVWHGWFLYASVMDSRA